MDGTTADGGDFEMALGASTPLRRWFASPRSHQALVFKAIESGVDRSEGEIFACAVRDVAPDGDTVRLAFESEHGKHDDVFEAAEECDWRHLIYYIEQITIERKVF
jgi:hypothetical protein